MRYRQLRAIPIVSLYTVEQTNKLKMDQVPGEIAEKTIEPAKSVKSTTNEVVISIVILRNDKLADKGSKVNSIAENFCKEEMR